MELEEWIRENKFDVCAISETGLNGDEYVELGTGYEWIGDWRSRYYSQSK